MTPIDRTAVTRLYVEMGSTEHLFLRNILASKGVKVQTFEQLPASLDQTCPTPTLVDDGTVLYNVEILADYIDQRFPDPALAPLPPRDRALTKLILHRIVTDWFPLAERHDYANLIKNITATRPAIQSTPFFQASEPGLIDAAIAALLERARLAGHQTHDPFYARYAETLAKTWPAPTPKKPNEDHSDLDPFDLPVQAAHG